MDSHEFLHLIWSEQPGPGYIILARRTNNHWEELPGVLYSEHLTLDPLIWFPEEGDDYFCPQLFHEPNRRKENALPSRWLYADLDVVDPRHIPAGIAPTISLQTSPGRYQAFWLLRLPLEPADHSQLNRNLTYALSADKGGWDITQVLRVAHTYNRKYLRPFKVRVLDYNPHLVYNQEVFEDYLQTIKAGLTTDLVDMPPLIMPVEKPLELRQKFWPKLTDRAHYLLLSSSPGPDDDRSARLWELECLLLEAGLTPEETFVLVRDSVWNKFKARHGGDTQLWTEVQKANSQVTVNWDTYKGQRRLVIQQSTISYRELLGQKLEEPGWLIDNWWTENSQGMIAGLPKSFKSLVALEMAFSVATGTPLLNQPQFATEKEGPVLFIQLENSRVMMVDRLLKIGHTRGFGGRIVHHKPHEVFVDYPRSTNVPIHFHKSYAFDMTLPEDREYVQDRIRDEGIRMVVFDPLYMMLGGIDENHTKEIRPLLNWLMTLRTNFNCSVVVVHHYTKSSSNPLSGVTQGGAKLMGSTLLWGWLECGIYLTARDRNSAGYTPLSVEREFRERAPIGPTTMYLRLGDPGKYDQYDWMLKTLELVKENEGDASERSYHD
jgi:hypothetical protein